MKRWRRRWRGRREFGNNVWSEVTALAAVMYLTREEEYVSGDARRWRKHGEDEHASETKSNNESESRRHRHGRLAYTAELLPKVGGCSLW